MKTLIFKLLIILPFFCNAQLFHYGLKGGLNLSDANSGFIYTSVDNMTYISNSQTRTLQVTSSPSVSFYIGGFSEFMFSKKSKFALQVELVYAQNGTNIDAKESNENEDFSYSTAGTRIKVNQLNIPILLKFYPTTNFSVDGGFYGGYIFTAKSIDNDNVTTFADENTLNKFDYGLIIGATYNLQNNMFFEFRYNHGLSDLENWKESYFSDTFESYYKNRTLHFGIGYKFK